MAAAEVTPMIPEPAEPVEAPETPAVETPEVETPAAPETPAPEAPEADKPAPAAEDGRQIPTALRQHLANLAAKPETQALAKQIKADFFALRAYREVAPSPKDVIALKEFQDSIGGPEGLEAIEAERSEWASLDEQYSNGDPKFIENIAAESPEAFEKLVPHALSQFEKQNPEMYEHLMARVMANTFNVRGGVADLVQKAIDGAKSLNNPALNEVLGGIQSWLRYFDEKAQKIPEKKIDPERQKLEQERTAFEQEREQAFVTQLQGQVTGYTQNEVKRLLTGHLGSRTIADDDLVVFYNNVIQYITPLLNGDKAYTDRSQRYLQAKDADGAVKYAKEKMAAILPNAVAKVYKRFYSIGAGGKVQAKPQAAPAGKAPATPAPQGWVRVQGPPKVEEVDHGKTSQSMKWASQAILRNGKKVFWGDKVPA